MNYDAKAQIGFQVFTTCVPLQSKDVISCRYRAAV